MTSIAIIGAGQTGASAALAISSVLPQTKENERFTLLNAEAHVAAANGDWRRAIALRRETVRMATEGKLRGVVIAQEVHLAEALHAAGERTALEKLVTGMLPEVERSGLRGSARILRALLASPPRKS